MDAIMKRAVWRGMAVCLVLGLLQGTSGCVSRSAYEVEVEKNQHLQYVKTEQDIERDGLHADVGALRRAYSEQSLRMTFLEGVVQQTAQELKHIDAKLSGVDGKLAALGMDVKQQQGEFVRVTAQGAETMRLLESMRETQQESRQALVGVATKLDWMKKVVASRSMVISGESADGKTTGKAEKADTVSPAKGAGERVVDPKLSLRPVGDGKEGERNIVVDRKNPGVVGEGKEATVSSIPESASGEVAPPVITERNLPVTSVGVAAQDQGSQKVMTTADGKQGADIGDRSPLLFPNTGAVVLSDKGTPVKKTWGEWASDKYESAKQTVIGKKPVQTAAESPGGAPSNGKQ